MMQRVGWQGQGVKELQGVGELDVYFFEFPDCMAQSLETSRAVGW